MTEFLYEKEMNEIFQKLSNNLPNFWDGKKCIEYMKENNCKNWRQMEWIGFYFQFMCEKILSQNNFMQIPGTKYGNVEFDGFKTIPWDFKAHSTNKNKSDNGKIPTNGCEESFQAIKDFGTIGFIIISGKSDYDDDNQTFKQWHDSFKGGTSNYEKERIKRNAPSRKRKINFTPEELIFVFVDNRSNCLIIIGIYAFVAGITNFQIVWIIVFYFYFFLLCVKTIRCAIIPIQIFVFCFCDSNFCCVAFDRFCYAIAICNSNNTFVCS